MTPSRYYVARFVQAFGIQRRQLRMGEAASEMHLLREAEAHLGALVWEKVEGVEELSIEYWNLRKLLKQSDETADRLAELEAALQSAHEERAELLNAVDEPHQEVLARRAEILEELEVLSNERDDVVNRARQVRRTYDGLKLKLDVVSDDPAEAEKVRKRLTELKAEFERLKQLRVDIGRKIEEGDARIDELDGELDEKRKSRRGQASEAFHQIGDANKEISTLRAQLGMMQTQMLKLYSEIGRFVSRNAKVNPDCAAAARAHRGLIEVMRALRQSIALNHRLAGMS